MTTEARLCCNAVNDAIADLAEALAFAPKAGPGGLARQLGDVHGLLVKVIASIEEYHRPTLPPAAPSALALATEGVAA